MSHRITTLSIVLAFAGALSTAQSVSAQGIADDGSITGGVNGLYWTRSDPQSVPTGLPGVELDNADMGWEPGVETWVHTQGADGLGIDARYFWVNSFDGTTGGSGVIGPFAVDAEFSLESKLQGAEISRTIQLNDNISLLGGFRWIELDETFNQNVSIPALGAIATQTDEAHNHLFGGQVGGSALVWSGANFEIDLVGKLGLYSNQGETNSTTTLTGVAPASASDQNGQLAWTSDARLGASWWLTQNVVANGGYQVLYLDGIVRSETAALIGGAEASDSLFFHGAFFGLTYYRP